MRPPKVILLIDTEQRASVLRFTLRTNGFRVFMAHTKDEALIEFWDIHQNGGIDLIILDGAFVDLAPILKQHARHVPLILMCSKAQLADLHPAADAALDKAAVTTFELIDRIKVMVARKRGPKKGTKRATESVSFCSLSA